MIVAKKRICIVDDDKGVHEFLEDYIRSFTKDVIITHAYNGHEGLVKMDGIKFDLLISDLNMPHMKGGNMLKHVFRMNKKFIPDHILVFSGLVDPENMKPTKIKNLTYMSKPFDETDFNQYLNMVLKVNSIHKFENISDTKFINPFIEAVKEVSRLSFEHDVELKRVFVKKPTDHFSEQLACSVNFFCDDMHGSFVFEMSQELYFSFLKQGKDIDINKLTDKSTRHFKSLTEQIADYSQRKLSAMGEQVHYTISEVEYGERVELPHLFKGPNLVLEFENDSRPFHMEIILKKSAA